MAQINEIVFGIVGSGKTELAVRRTLDILRETPSFNVFVASFTHATERNFAERFRERVYDYGLDNFFSNKEELGMFLNENIRTLHSLAYRSIGFKIDILESTPKYLKDFGKELKEKLKIDFSHKGFNLVFDLGYIKVPFGNLLFQCYNYIYNTNPTPSDNEKLKLISNFSKLTNRSINPHQYFKFEEFLEKFVEDHNITTYTKLLLEFYNYLKQTNPIFEYVVVDEAQELTNLMFLIVERLGRNILIFGDLAQRVYYAFGENNKIIDILAKSHTQFLNKTHRIPKGLAHVVDPLLKKIYKKYKLRIPKIEYLKIGGNLEVQNLNNFTFEQILSRAYLDVKRGYSVAVLCRFNPTLLKIRRTSLELFYPNKVYSGISDIYLDQWFYINVIADLNREQNIKGQTLNTAKDYFEYLKEKYRINDKYKLWELRKFLNKLEIKYGLKNISEIEKSLIQREIQNFTLSTIHSSKGFEFDIVYLILEISNRKFLNAKEYEVVFTGLTRAKEKLIIYVRPSLWQTLLS